MNLKEYCQYLSLYTQSFCDFFGIDDIEINIQICVREGQVDLKSLKMGNNIFKS